MKEQKVDMGRSHQMVCLNPKCKEKKTKTRGLCGKCYEMARYYIRTGKTTWAILEKKGLATSSRKKRTGDWIFENDHNR